MNTQKWGMGNCGLFAEADRTMYIDKETGEYKTNQKDTVSKSIIDFTKTHMNYNLCPHEQYKRWQVKEINEKIRGKKIAKNAISWGSTIISLPKDYNGDPKTFFATSYEGMKKMYGLRDEDIISAYVHMDESTPHMHFYFIPISHEAEKDRINWDKVVPRKMYKTQHKILQKYMRAKIPNATINLLNGETIGLDVSKMDANQRKASMQLMETTKKAENKQLEVETLDIFIGEKQATLTSLDEKIEAKRAEAERIAETIFKPFQTAVERLIETFKALKPKQQAKEQESVFDILKESNIVFGKKNAREIGKATTAMNKKSDDIEATYLSIDDDDDFER